MTSPISTIEQDVVSWLRRAQRGYQLRSVESYGAQLDDELFGWVRALPAVWVTFDGGQVVRKSARQFMVTGTFEVLAAQYALVHERGRQAGAEAGGDVGVYQILEDNKLALSNRTLGLRIQPFTPGAIRPVMKGLVNRDAVVVYAQTYTTSWLETIPEPDASPAGELRLIGVDYLLKPGDNTPDASDLVTLANPA